MEVPSLCHPSSFRYFGRSFGLPVTGICRDNPGPRLDFPVSRWEEGPSKVGLATLESLCVLWSFFGVYALGCLVPVSNLLFHWTRTLLHCHCRRRCDLPGTGVYLCKTHVGDSWVYDRTTHVIEPVGVPSGHSTHPSQRNRYFTPV